MGEIMQTDYQKIPRGNLCSLPRGQIYVYGKIMKLPLVQLTYREG
jgi:hypothetical protein